MEEKKIKIPDFLIDKIKPKNNYQRSTQKFLNPYQVNNLENIITNSIKNIPDEQKPFCLVIKIAELLVIYTIILF